MLGFLIAVLSGALMSVQGVFNTEVTKQSGVWIAACFVQATAFAVCLILWLFTGRDSSLTEVLQTQPKYLLLGGAFGAVITFTVITGIAKLGPAKAAMLIVVAQILVSYLIERFGLFGTEKTDFQWRQLAGMVLVGAGLAIVKW